MRNVKYVLLNKHDFSEAYENHSQSAFEKILAFVRHKHFARILAFFALITTLQLLHMRYYYDEATRLYETTMQIEVEEYNVTATESVSYVIKHNETRSQYEYFIHTSQCRIPYVEPFGENVLKIFNPLKYRYTNCTKDEAFITSIYQLNARQYFLHMNMENIERTVKPLNATATDVRCCYRQIVRAGRGGSADSKYNLLNCVTFHQDFLVPLHIDFIITECYLGANDKNPLQKDAFSFIQVTKKTNSTINTNETKVSGKRKPSVLLIGIDAVSRINLRRTMPQTFKYLQMNQWAELLGYNKIGDNTFPNLMALLTSYNLTMAQAKCLPKAVGGLNNPLCNFIWNDFKRFGYKTAYAEDTSSMSTFNYRKKGFERPPTDYYLRPFTMAVEKVLKVTKKAGLSYCVGRKHYGEYIYDYALQFANAYPEEPLFGLFWTNSFSHNAFDIEATMDVKVLEYLKKLKIDGILERSIVIFLADHGIRWGKLLKLKSGFLEERLPMFFISLPPWYRKQYQNFVKILQTNQKRLTTPYDIYATMKHILEVTQPEIEFPILNGTIRGISIFREIPENRTCNDAGIPEHWCTCVPYEVVPTKDEVAKNVTLLVLKEMNQYLVNKNISDKCAELKLEAIDSAQMKMIKVPNESTFRISFEANPEKARFQATVVYNITANTIKTDVEDISRLDSYEKTSNCIDLKEEKKYCVCKK
ncbi:PREDICTED: uncharacterized protein LOC108965952 [Bactrocera latifrons]|uniref:uncharacterized protein LOC108965952 n=1 Tax=Bactrocera latifrons TaxID=174628 RepID=UPI0008DC7DE5|nr:PREDICTED: uncharacterized protein LOC108965952 [Bactrocera latifrons]